MNHGRPVPESPRRLGLSSCWCGTAPRVLFKSARALLSAHLLPFIQVRNPEVRRIPRISINSRAVSRRRKAGLWNRPRARYDNQRSRETLWCAAELAPTSARPEGAHLPLKPGNWSRREIACWQAYGPGAWFPGVPRGLTNRSIQLVENQAVNTSSSSRVSRKVSGLYRFGLGRVKSFLEGPPPPPCPGAQGLELRRGVSTT